MGNCLVTKLKESVNNDNLEFIDKLRVNVNIGSEAQLALSANNIETTFNVVNNQPYISDYTHGWTSEITKNVNKESGIILKEGVAFSIDIYNKYNPFTEVIMTSNRLSTNLCNFKYIPTLLKIQMQGSSVLGELSDIEGLANLTYLGLPVGVSGNISSLSSLKNLEKLNLSEVTNINGNISSFGPLTKLTDILLPSNKKLIDGSVEDFVYGQVNADSNPRTSVSTPITFWGLLKNASFNGSFINNDYYNFIQWNGTNKIAVYLGSYVLEGCDTVYCKGYGTQEQAEAELMTGNVTTVIRVDA